MDYKTLEQQINDYMVLFFQAKEDFSTLTEDNKILVSNVENLVATLPRETAIGKIINKKLIELCTYLKLSRVDCCLPC